MKVTPQTVLGFLSYCNGMLSQASINSYQQRLGRFVRFAGERSATGPLITEWYKTLYAGGASASSVQAYWTTLKSFFSWSEKVGLVKGSPVPAPPRIPRALPKRSAFTEDEYESMVEVSGESPNLYWPLAMRIAWGTGLRLGDVALLKWDQVEIEEKIIRLTPQKTKRRNKVVEIPISAALAASLSLMPPLDVYVMPEMARKYLGIGHRKLWDEFRFILDLAGISGKSFHCFRHSFVTRLVDAGTSHLVISSMSGHSLAQLSTYSHPSLESKRKALGI